MRTWNIEETLSSQWVAECEAAAASDAAFAVFRQGPAMQAICENRSRYDNPKAWDGIRQLSPYLGSNPGIFAANDQFGGAQTLPVDGVELSGNTSWYVYALALMEWLFGDLHRQTWIEIGGGYGGLAAAAWAAYNPVSFTIYDLPAASRLQRRYLSALDRAVCLPALGDPAPGAFDILHSWCGLAELPPDVRDQYIPVLQRARCGLLLWNRVKDLDPTEPSQEETLAWLNQVMAPRSVTWGVPCLHDVYDGLGGHPPFMFFWGHTRRFPA